MKKILLILGVVLISAAIGIALLINKLDADVEVILQEKITDIDFSQYENGTYIGIYEEALAVSAKVEVIILNGEITNIEILNHRNGQGEAAEVIIDDVIVEQSLMVDDISGATYSSRVIKLAIENAMLGENNE